MPTNVVRTSADEEKWKRAKKIVADQGKGKNYALIMHIYQNMKKGLPVDTKNPRLLLKAEQLTMFGGGGGGGKKGGGEGSRGGKVIGHTKSGKPIYESKSKSSAMDRVWQGHHDKMLHHGEIATAFERHTPANTHGIVPRAPFRGESGRAHHDAGEEHVKAQAPLRSGEHHKYVAANMHDSAQKATKRANATVSAEMGDLVDHHKKIAKDHQDAVDRLTEMHAGGRTGLPNILRRHIANHERARDAHKAAAAQANIAMRSADAGQLTATHVRTALGHSNSAQRASVAADHEGRWKGHPGKTGVAAVPNRFSAGVSQSPKHGARAEYHFQNAVHALAAGDDKSYGHHMDAGKAHRRAEDAHDEGHPDRYKEADAAWEASKRARRMPGGALHKSEETDMDLYKAGGEGSRGGKIIGHTRSGKPIYAPKVGASARDHKKHFHATTDASWTANDHADAALAMQDFQMKDLKNKEAFSAGQEMRDHHWQARHAKGGRSGPSFTEGKTTKKPGKPAVTSYTLDPGPSYTRVAEKSMEDDMDLMKSFDALEKAAQFTPRGGNDPKAMQPKGAKAAGPPAQQQLDSHAQQVIGHTADGQPVYGEQEVLEKIDSAGAAPADGGAGPAGGGAQAKPSAPAPKPSAPAPGGQAAGIPMGQGDAAKGMNGMNGNGNGNGNGANGEGTHEHHRDKALAHLQAASKHAEAAHSAKRVDEAKEHGQVVQQAQAASHAAVSGTSPPATGIGGAAGAGGPMPQGAPGKPPQIGKPAGGQDGAPADGVPPPGDDGVPSNGPGGDDEDEDAKKGKPFGKSEWLARYRPELRDGVDDLHKSLGLMYDRDVTSWAGQFAGSPLYEQALTLLKKQLETGRKHELERKAMPTWSEIDEMPKSKRILVRKKQSEVFDRHQKERQAMDIERDQLEMKLIDHKIAQAAKMREAAMAKARHQEADTLRKSDPAPAAPPAQATVLRKGRMEIRVDGGDEDQILKAIEDGTTVIGAQGSTLPQDGRHLLLGRRGTRLEKSGGVAGGTIFQGEHDGQGSRGGDYRESYARAQEFVNIQDDDPAGNRGQGGLSQWFSDAWSPHDPTQRVPANVSEKAGGWQKSHDTVRVIDDSTPYGRASVVRPQEHASSARMLAQGGRRDMVGGRR